MKRTTEASGRADQEEPLSKRFKPTVSINNISSESLITVFEFCSVHQILFVLPVVCQEWFSTWKAFELYLIRAVCFYEWPILKFSGHEFDWRLLLKTFGKETIQFQSPYMVDKMKQFKNNLNDPRADDPDLCLQFVEPIAEFVNKLRSWRTRKIEYQAKWDQNNRKYEQLMQLKHADVDIQIDDEDDDDSDCEGLDDVTIQAKLEKLFMEWIGMSQDSAGDPDRRVSDQFEFASKMVVSPAGTSVRVSYHIPCVEILVIHSGETKTIIGLNPSRFNFMDQFRTLYALLGLKAISYKSLWDILTTFTTECANRGISKCRQLGNAELIVYAQQNSVHSEIKDSDFQIERVNVNSTRNYEQGRQYLLQNPSAFAHAPSKYWRDFDLVISLIQLQPACYLHLPSKIQRDTVLLGKMAQLTPEALLKNAKARYYNKNVEVIEHLSTSVANNPSLIQKVPELLRDRPYFVMGLLNINGALLGHLSNQWRKSVDAAMVAMESNFEAIKYIDPSLLGNQEIKRLILNKYTPLYANSLKQLIREAPDVTADRTFINELLNKCLSIISALPGNMVTVQQICAAAKQDLSNLHSFNFPKHKFLRREDADFILLHDAILKTESYSDKTKIISSGLPRLFVLDLEIMKRLIELNCLELHNAPIQLRLDKCYLGYLVTANPDKAYWIYSQAAHQIQIDEPFLLSCFRQSRDRQKWRELPLEVSRSTLVTLLNEGARFDIVPGSKRIAFADNAVFVDSLLCHGTDDQIMTIITYSKLISNDRNYIVSLLRRRRRIDPFLRGRLTPFKKFYQEKVSTLPADTPQNDKVSKINLLWQQLSSAQKEAYNRDLHIMTLGTFNWYTYISPDLLRDPEITALLRYS